MDLRQYAAAQDFTEEPTPTPPAPILAREQAQEAQERTRAAEVYKKYQENIKASELAKTALRKGILAGASPYRLLLLATDIVGRLTADAEFAEGTRSDLKSPGAGAGGGGGPSGTHESIPGREPWPSAHGDPGT